MRTSAKAVAVSPWKPAAIRAASEINQKSLAPEFRLLTGFTVAALISLFAPLTQAGWNPARDFGPRVVAYFAGWGGDSHTGPARRLLGVHSGPDAGRSARRGAARADYQARANFSRRRRARMTGASRADANHASVPPIPAGFVITCSRREWARIARASAQPAPVL